VVGARAVSWRYPIHLAIITFGYPPLRHVSGTRPSHLARELTRRGHRVTVLTVDWSSPEAPRAAPSPDDPEVIAIDPHLGDNGEFYEDAETFTEFLANIERAGVSDVVQPIRAFSHEARPLVADASVSVLFLDGSHRYEDVSTDLRDWLPALCDGAILACNDSSKPGVYRALCETVLRRRAPFAAATLVRSTLFVEHCPDRTWTRADDIAWLKLRSVLFSRRVVHRFVRFLPGWAKRAGNAISQHVVHAGPDMPRS